MIVIFPTRFGASSARDFLDDIFPSEPVRVIKFTNFTPEHHSYADEYLLYLRTYR